MNHTLPSELETRFLQWWNEGDIQPALLQSIAMQENAAEQMLESAGACLQADAGRAEKLACCAAALFAMQQNSLAQARSLRVQGQALRALARHDAALQTLQEAAEAALRGNDRGLSLSVQLGSIDSFAILGRYSDAEKLGKRLILEMEEAGMSLDCGRALVNLGNTYFRSDDYEQALQMYQAAEAHFGSTIDPQILATLQVNIANSLTHLDRIAESVSRYQTARDLFIQAGSEINTAAVDTNLGYLEYVSGNYTQALTCFMRSASVFERFHRTHEAVRCNIDAAGAYLALNLYPEALECCAKAMAGLQTVESEYDRARAHAISASVYLRLQQTEQAEKEILEAEKIFTATKNSVQQAHCALIKGWIYRSVYKPVEAEEAAAKACKIFRKSHLPGWAAEAAYLQADLYLATGRNAVRQMSMVARHARKCGRGWLECRAEYAIGAYMHRCSRISDAIRHYISAVDALESVRTLIVPEEFHVAFLDGKEKVYADLVALLLQRSHRGDTMTAMQYVEQSKSRILLEGILVNLNPRGDRDTTPEAYELQKKMLQARLDLNRAYHYGEALQPQVRLVNSRQVRKQEYTALEQQYRSLEHQCMLLGAGERPAWLQGRTTVSVEQLQQTLSADETLIEFFVLEDEVGAFVVTSKQIQAVRNLADAALVRREAHRFRFHMQRFMSHTPCSGNDTAEIGDVLHCVLKRLHNLLCAPLFHYVQTSRVLIAPYGDLHGLPFHAFMDEDGPMLLHHEILYTPSSSVWHAARTRQEGSSNAGLKPSSLVVGIAGAGYEQVEEECRQVAAMLPNSRLLLGEEATLEAFNRLAPDAQIIHVAAHAEFREDNPLFSGLKFADGWLTARDLYEMPLRCSLVTLSACSTGAVHVAPGDELFGLTRGLLLAGARSVAVSLWPADDHATHRLMNEFYRHMQQGKTASAALQQAQTMLYEALQHSYYWAPFLIVGGC